MKSKDAKCEQTWTMCKTKVQNSESSSQHEELSAHSDGDVESIGQESRHIQVKHQWREAVSLKAFTQAGFKLTQWTFGPGVVLEGRCEHKRCSLVRLKRTHSSSPLPELCCYVDVMKWRARRWPEQQVTSNKSTGVCVSIFNLYLSEFKQKLSTARLFLSRHGNTTLGQWFGI